jgi:signal peptidase II
VPVSIRVRLTAVTLATMLAGCDHATKHWAEQTLRAAPKIDLLPGALDLRYAQNPGIAFSGLTDLPEVLRFPIIVVLGVATVTMLVTLWLRQRPLSSGEHLAFALILGGALGNLIDRVMRGHVIDFIHLQHWPVFNVADICIVLGVLLFAYTSLRRARHEEAPS